MNIAEYYDQGRSIKDCAKKFKLTERTTLDKLREMGVDIDMPVASSMYDSYIKKIRVVRALFGYNDFDMQKLKETDYDTYFLLSWTYMKRSLTGRTK